MFYVFALYGFNIISFLITAGSGSIKTEKREEESGHLCLKPKPRRCVVISPDTHCLRTINQVLKQFPNVQYISNLYRLTN